MNQTQQEIFQRYQRYIIDYIQWYEKFGKKNLVLRMLAEEQWILLDLEHKTFAKLMMDHKTKDLLTFDGNHMRW